MKKQLISLILICIISDVASAGFHTISPTQLSETDFGGVGLWQTPSARMKPDGQFDFVYSHVWPYSRGNVVFQAFPWMEAIVRYTDISNVRYAASSTGQSNKDKSLDVKFRLAKEGYYLPAIAVGFRDFGGTGLFSSEYFVMSKRFNNFDFTLGIAWGNMAGGGVTGQWGNISNPMCHIANTFCDRNDRSAHGGTINWGKFFSGQRASLYGGVEYQTPYAPLRLKLEYDPNNYQHESAQNSHVLPQFSHWNFGAVYRLFHWCDLSLAYERGAEIMFGADISMSFSHPAKMPKLDVAPIKLVDHQSKPPKLPIFKYDAVDWTYIAKQLNKVAGLRVDAIYQQGNHLVLKGQQKRYRDPYLAMQRAGYVLYHLAPNRYQTFTVINEVYGLLFDEASVSRKQLKMIDSKRLIAFNEKEHQPKLVDIAVNYHPNIKALRHPIWQAKPKRLNYYFQPGLTQMLDSPDGFYLYRILLEGGVTYQFKQHWLLTGDLSYDILDNLEHYVYEPPTDPLPRVRSNIRRYLTTSRFSMKTLQLNYFHQLSRSWYGQVYGGYFEQMFAGVGAEVLYKPLGSRFAFSADVNYVRQRDFSVGFDLLPYTVTTGHFVIYYQWPIYHILSKLSVGQYLAGDDGVTIDISRQFKSGIILGGFVTRTNVSADQFGEGSYNKGVYIKIPLDIFSLSSTTSMANIGWVPLTRDGGQMLNRRYKLYDIASGDT